MPNHNPVTASGGANSSTSTSNTHPTTLSATPILAGGYGPARRTATFVHPLVEDVFVHADWDQDRIDTVLGRAVA